MQLREIVEKSKKTILNDERMNWAQDFTMIHVWTNQSLSTLALYRCRGSCESVNTPMSTAVTILALAELVEAMYKKIGRYVKR